MLKNKIVIITAVAVTIALVIVLVLTAVGFKSSNTDAQKALTFMVKRGPLTVNVVESGTIKAREQIIIKNEVEGKTSIIYLIPEGTRVTKGDLLVELDASALIDSRLDQEIKVQNAEASYVNAKENLAVAENQAKSDMDLAQLTLEFARQDLKKYTKGEYPNELKKTQADITLAEEELTRVRDTLKWSQTLYKEKYISQTELQADQLSEKKKALDLDLAKNNYALLVNYTHQRNLAQRKSDVSQAKMALERTQRKARADVIQARAELKARQAEYQRQKDKLEKFQEQIGKTKIYAPADGLVIYATSARGGLFRHNAEPLQEGQDIRERQELIYLPTGNSSNVEIAIHESNLKKVTVGLPVVVTVDALPGRKFTGRITHIAPLPDAQSLWMNPDLKVYTTQIFLDQKDNAVRTGMSCQAEIVIEEYADTLYVPVQAVMRIEGVPKVYVMNKTQFEPRTVETGLDNNRMIRVIKGIEPGDRVLLTPPLRAAGVDYTSLKKQPDVSAAMPAKQPSKKRNRHLKQQDGQ
ncbi:efflux RND transporter periplasmic adaptor subunit [Desulfobacula phenolica]|uniref:HlyD family secretion protein n=1 Tax=Desulfobacula phenolica TaxID=90732 RepID=A0A1H2IMX8_9BACT|nr:efflux RND transporter periplasmic adaptor subunit [Desulfobacula phenolica]SDU45315.1 HlyD family secretion protein [Desulfobacula phenolica]